MEKRELDKEFKDPKHPLRIVFVCAMWLTGFDVKCLSCLYLDKPLKAHTLMQTIARANRVSEGKSNGLIVDYIGIVKALRKALADYTANIGGKGEVDPTVDKEVLIARIHEVIDTAIAFLDERDFDLNLLISAATKFTKMSMVCEAANAVCGCIEDRRQFQTYASELNRLVKYANHDDLSADIWKQYDAIAEIYKQLNKKKKHADNTALMAQINQIISEYVQIEEQQEGITESKRFDISEIDFDLLRREFAKTRKKNLVIKDLDQLVQERIAALLFSNPQRIDYYERYQAIIQDYNNEQNRAAIEKTFMELMALAKSLDEEEQRYVREEFANDEELSIYDLLYKEGLTKQEIKKLKEVSASLLQKIKQKISELDHWTDKDETKSAVKNMIRDMLWTELPESYSDESIDEYRQRIFEYVMVRYQDIA